MDSGSSESPASLKRVASPAAKAAMSGEGESWMGASYSGIKHKNSALCQSQESGCGVQVVVKSKCKSVCLQNNWELLLE